MNTNQLLQSKRLEILQIAARHGATNVRVFGLGGAWRGPSRQ